VNLVVSFFEVDANRMVLNFGHGLIFFLMGFGVLLKSKRWSELALARCLPLLGAFGISNAIGDWGLVFLPIQQQVFPRELMAVLWILDEAVLALSYALLLAFGLRLAAATDRRFEWLPRLVPIGYGAWLITLLFSVVSGEVDPVASPASLYSFAVVYRYAFALPGSLVSAWALYLQRGELSRLGLGSSVPSLRWVGIAVAAHGVAAGLTVPESAFFVAAAQEAYFPWSGVPARFITGLSGAIMAVFIIMVLDVFDHEIHRRVEEARSVRAVVEERLRIARDLHDGIIQTLYALGLALEGVLLSIDTSTAEAKEEVRGIMRSLDQTIKDVRGYILKLKTPDDEVSLDEHLRLLQKQLQQEARIPIRLQTAAVEPGILSSDAIRDILLAVREAVSNALRHARASQVEIILERGSGVLRVRVIDDGIGFDPEKAPKASGGEHMGLDNMRRRAESVGGRLMISSEPTVGTEVTLEVPLREGGV